jgi:hypothetical protein
VIGIIYIGAAAAFNAFSGSATILLGLSYILPVSMSLLERRQKVKNAPWSLGKFGYAINGVACEFPLYTVRKETLSWSWSDIASYPS